MKQEFSKRDLSGRYEVRKDKPKSPPLKKWNKRNLAERDWNFAEFCLALEDVSSELPEDEASGLVYRAFTWEIDRELGSGRGPFDLDNELAARPVLAKDDRERTIVLLAQGGTLVKEIERPLWLFKQRAIGSPLFSIGDIKELKSFVDMFKRPTIPVTEFLLCQFSDSTRQQLKSCGDSLPDLGPVSAALVKELNRIIQGCSIYDKKRFGGVKLSDETIAQGQENPRGKRLTRFNRMLLEDTYLVYLAKRPRRAEPLYEWHLGELAHYVTPDTYGASRASNDICALEIPWHGGEEEVVDSFRLWLRENRSRHPGKTGRPYEWRSQFLNLAIYRLSSARYRTKEALAKLERFFEQLGRNECSLSNFSRAKRTIKVEILRRFAELSYKAKQSAKYSQARSGWRSHFLRQ